MQLFLHLVITQSNLKGLRMKHSVSHQFIAKVILRLVKSADF